MLRFLLLGLATGAAFRPAHETKAVLKNGLREVWEALWSPVRVTFTCSPAKMSVSTVSSSHNTDCSPTCWPCITVAAAAVLMFAAAPKLAKYWTIRLAIGGLVGVAALSQLMTLVR